MNPSITPADEYPDVDCIPGPKCPRCGTSAPLLPFQSVCIECSRVPFWR